jgi:hypothetical protein
MWLNELMLNYKTSQTETFSTKNIQNSYMKRLQAYVQTDKCFIKT